MQYQKDFAELCALSNANGIEYLVVGGYAVAFHGAPRFTGEFDIFVRASEDTLKRVFVVVREFGFRTDGVVPDYLLRHRKILQLGQPPVQIHLMTSITGVTWEDAWQSRKMETYGGVPVPFLGRNALILNKTATGRTKDLADVEALQRKPPP